MPRPKSRPSPGRSTSTVVACVLLGTAGYGGTSPCVVTGTVLVDDQPAVGVYLVFHTVGGPARRPASGTARSGGDGSFSLVVSEPGESVVTAFWPTVTVKDVETIEGPDRFKGAHRDPGQPVARATLREGENNLPPITIIGPTKSKASTRDRR